MLPSSNFLLYKQEPQIITTFLLGTSGVPGSELHYFLICVKKSAGGPPGPEAALVPPNAEKPAAP